MKILIVNVTQYNNDVPHRSVENVYNIKRTVNIIIQNVDSVWERERERTNLNKKKLLMILYYYFYDCYNRYVD